MRRLLDTFLPISLTPVEKAAVLDGAPSAGSRPLAAVSGAEIGVWEMTPGVATDVEVDEVFVVLSGSATVQFDDGSTIDIEPGSTVRLRAGDRTTWTVRATLRKVYITGTDI